MGVLDRCASLPAVDETTRRGGCSKRCSDLGTFFRESYIAIRFPSSKAQMHGYLWKLNSGVDATPDFFVTLANWRRRLFFLKKTRGNVSLSYISEKENGQLHLACILNGRGSAVTVKALPAIEMEEVSASGVVE